MLLCLRHKAWQHQEASLATFIQQIVGYLSSGSPILVTEALDVLAQRIELLQDEAVALALESAWDSSDGSERMAEPSQGRGTLADGLLEVFRLLLRLGWSPQEIQADLQQQFGLHTISQLSEEQVNLWMGQLLHLLN